MSDIDKILALDNRTLSEEQMEAVKSRCATLVTAAAGSGKTTVLSYRFIDLILTEGVHSNEILTITFTKKAANEMFSRIYSLLTLGAENGIDEFKAELNEYFPKAQISTIDSFWTKIARSAALSYGISENFVIADDDTLKELTGLVLDEIIEDFKGGNDNLKEAEEGYRIISQVKRKDEILTIFQSVAKEADLFMDASSDRQERVYREFIWRLEKNSQHDDIYSYIDEEIESVADSIAPYYNNGESFRENQYYLSVKEALKKRDLTLLPEEFNRDMEKRRLKPKPRGTNELGGKDRLVEYVKDFEKRVSPLIASKVLDEALDKQKKVFALTELFIKRLNEEKRKRFMLTYQDVMELSKKTLKENDGVRSYFRDQYKWIMVDEFQDTNEDQKDILLYLLPEDQYGDLDGRKLFFVGDDKQSVYRFRGADVQVFNRLKSEIVDEFGGKVIELSDNYRSDPAIIEHVNEFQEAAFSEDREDLDTTYDFLSAFFDDFSEEYRTKKQRSTFPKSKEALQNAYKTTISFRSRIKSNSRDGGGDDLKNGENEAENIARLIESMLSTDGFLIYKDGEYRRPTSSDIGVLFSKNDNQRELERALNRHSIPYKILSSRSLTQSGLTYDLVSFLSTLIYSDDEKAFMTVLASPMVRLSEDGMTRVITSSIRSFDADSAYYGLEGEDAISYDEIRSLYREVREYLENEGTLTGAIERIYYKSGYRAFLMASSHRAQFESYYQNLWELAFKEEMDGGSIVTFLDKMRPKLGDEKSEFEFSVEYLNDEGVNLMTVHKAKGLEFPIVIYSYLSSQLINSSVDNTVVSIRHDGSKTVIVDLNASFLFKENKKWIGSSFGLANSYSGIERKMELEEKRRVIYVALTRAINHLVVTSYVNKEDSKSKTKTYASLYYDEFIKENDRYTDKCLPLDEIPPIELFSESKEERPFNWYKGEEAKEGEIHYKGSALKAYSHRFDEDYETNGERLPSLKADEIFIQYPDARPYFGTLVHQALEKRVFDRKYEYDSMDGLPEDIKGGLIEEAERIASLFIESDFYRNQVEPYDKDGEVGFTSLDGDVVLSGVMDLVVFRDDSVLVVDYKTDAFKNPLFHKEQIMGYMRALRELYGKKTYGLCLFVRDFSTGPLWELE